MASKTHEIAFRIAGQMSGSFSKTFATAQKTVDGFSRSTVNMNQKAAQIDNVIRLKKETGEAARAYYQASQKVAELGREIHSTKEPTKEMTAEFKRAKAAVEKSKNTLDKKRMALKEVEQAAGTTGESLRSLIHRQKQLAESADKARVAQEKMAKATELQQKAKGMVTSGTMGLASTAAATAPIVMTVKAAMDFEDMRAELGKYSDEAADIFAGIEKLTGKYSKSAADMTAMAANAMQSGIAKTKEDVLELVESQTQAAVAFGMTGDAVGEAWASIQSKMGTSVSETKAVFDIVNKLGNETSASSEDILNVLQRQGGAVKSLTALNEKQVAALAGAFRSASTSSEVAATSMGTFVSRLTVGASATKAQQKAFDALGLDAEDVAKRMTKSGASAEATIKEVFARINKLSPDKRGAVIGQLFGNEAGIKAAVATLSANGKLLGDNLKMVGNDANYAGSMFNEYMARANTTSEALGIFKNQLITISAKIGQSMLPTIKSMAQSFISVAQKVASFVANNQELVGGIVKALTVILACKAAFHVLQITFGLLIQPILSVYKAFQLVKGAIAMYRAGATLATATTTAQKVALIAVRGAAMAWKGVMAVCTGVQKLWTAAKNGTLLALVKEKIALVASKVAMIANAVATKVAAAAQWLLNSAFLACPITWIVAGIAAIIAIGILLYKNWDKIKAKMVELWQSFASKFPSMSRIVQIAALPIKVAIQVVINIFKLLKAAGIALWNGLKWCWSGIKSITVSAWQEIQKPLMNAWEKFKQFAGYVKTKFVNAFQGFRNKVASVFKGLVGIIKAPMNAVIRLVNKAIGAINKINVKIPKWAGGGSIGFNIAKIPQLAKGGIATSPTLAMIGEGKESEAVLPLSKLESMIGGGDGGGNITVNFAPVINISGGTGNVTDDVQKGIDAGLRELEKMLKKIQTNKRRVSFV